MPLMPKPPPPTTMDEIHDRCLYYVTDRIPTNAALALFMATPAYREAKGRLDAVLGFGDLDEAVEAGKVFCRTMRGLLPALKGPR